MGLALLLPLAVAPVLATVPQTLNYQGILTNSADQPLNAPAAAPLQMTFKLFVALTGGTALYTEQQAVIVTNGAFNVQIGSVTPLTLPFDVAYFLEITIGAETLNPRQPLASAAYALRTGCIPGDRVTCFSFPTGTPGVGPCQTGVRVCNPQGTGFGTCAGEVGPNCGSVCANLQTDNNNCGTCGHVCNLPQSCGGGGVPGQCGPAVAACGNGTIDAGEQCDGANLNGQSCIGLGFAGGSLACSPSCTFNTSACTAATICGNGIVQAGEQCDDGNTSNGDGCSSTCQIQSGFTCSGSPSVCTTICGDGIRAGADTCDQGGGNITNGDGCSSTCQVEPGFICTGTPSVCTTTCGDGIRAGAEQCDQGNVTNGDGCSSTCQVEPGFICTGTPSVCTTTCGDGVRAGAEQCDDGNTINGDGCSSTCQVQLGFYCAGSPSVCSTICGDGIVAGNEQCDDAPPAENGDGCSATCTIEPGFTCSGSPSVCTPSLLANGNACATATQCQSGFCVDNYCSNTACSGVCLATNLVGALGVCTAIPFGQPDSNPVCSGIQACNGAGLCLGKTGAACTVHAQCLSLDCQSSLCK